MEAVVVVIRPPGVGVIGEALDVGTVGVARLAVGAREDVAFEIIGEMPGLALAAVEGHELAVGVAHEGGVADEAGGTFGPAVFADVRLNERPGREEAESMADVPPIKLSEGRLLSTCGGANG